MGRAKQGISAAAVTQTRRTQALQGGNMMVVRDLLARTTPWHQQYREINENAIQAITEGPGSGQVFWKPAADMDVNKLSCIDQGQGMTGPNMVKFLNTLAESGRSQGVGHNHGVGAKITMMASNKEGVEVRSWVDGLGGARVLLTPDGIVELRPGLTPPHNFFEPLKDSSLKPKEIGSHGTMVILLGNTPDDDTTKLPKGAIKEGYGEKWLSRYLNSKYTNIPNGVDISVHEKRTVRPVTGAHDWLNRTSIDSGVKEMNGAKVRWWLLGEKDGEDTEIKRSTAGGYALVDAHVALLSGKETYDTKKASEGRSLLREAGLLYGSGRVALHVEPKKGAWHANAERTRLFNAEGEEFDVRTLMKEFSEDMPQSLADFVEAEAAKETAKFDPNAAIAERMNKSAGFMRMLHAPSDGENGSWVVSKTVVPGSGDGEEVEGPGVDFSSFGPSKGKSTKKKSAGDKPKSDSAPRKRSGSKIKEEYVVSNLPQVIVEDDADFDAIVSYDVTNNHLMFNVGSKPMKRIIDHLTAERVKEMRVGSSPSRKKAVEDRVRQVVVETFGTGVIETVLGARSIAEQFGWDETQLKSALSDEALSASALQSSANLPQIKQILSTAFGGKS